MYVHPSLQHPSLPASLSGRCKSNSPFGGCSARVLTRAAGFAPDPPSRCLIHHSRQCSSTRSLSLSGTVPGASSVVLRSALASVGSALTALRARLSNRDIAPLSSAVIKLAEPPQRRPLSHHDGRRGVHQLGEHRVPRWRHVRLPTTHPSHPAALPTLANCSLSVERV